MKKKVLVLMAGMVVCFPNQITMASEVVEMTQDTTEESSVITDVDNEETIDSSDEYVTQETENSNDVSEIENTEESNSELETSDTIVNPEITEETNEPETEEVEIQRSLNEPPQLVYQAHGQTYAWQEIIRDGGIAGSLGQSKRVEAIKINIENRDALPQGDIEYRTHVQKKGWMDWGRNGATNGTTGLGLQVEALQVRLTGDLAKEYDVYFRVHSAIFGWLDWAKSDEATIGTAGTEGLSTRVEAFQVQLVKKGENPNLSTARPFVPSIQPSLDYQVHGQNYGWQNVVNNNTVAGMAGKRMEAIKINIPDSNLSGGIEYSANVQNQGWQNYVSNTQLAGTVGQGKRMEAIKIRLTGELSRYYDIYYHVSVSGKGWLGWTRNDGIAGTIGANQQIDAIQIQLIKKGHPAPALGQSYLTSTDYHNPDANRNKLLNQARGYVSDYQYHPNNNIFTSKYNRYHNGWCTLFIEYTFDQAGLGNLFYGGQYEWDPQVVFAYHRARGEVVTNPLPGDIAFVDWQGRGHITHAEIVESVGGNNLINITGNWGNRVTRVNRPKSQVLGYVRPKY